MEEREWVYNRSKREHQIPIGRNEDGSPVETVVIPAGEARQLPKEVAEAFMKRYTGDFIYGQSKENASKVRHELKKLREENRALVEENFKLVKEIEELKKKGEGAPRRGRPPKVESDDS